LLFNIESESELDVLLDESSNQMKRGGATPSVSIGVNPDVQAGGHPHISTGHHQHKFGLDWSAARELYIKHRDPRWIRWRGLSAHIGSQITALRQFQQALTRLVAFVRELRELGIDLKYLDFGGGLGVRYTDQKPPSRIHYACMIARTVKPLGVHLLLEPGRTIIAHAGVLLTRIQYIKTNRRKSFVVVDAGMNDLLRPALYGAIHPITRVTRTKSEKSSGARINSATVDIVGPVCESGDCFLRNWPLGTVKPGEVLAIWAAGAYGRSLASNYNARPRPAEILVQGKRARLIRRRERRRPPPHRRARMVRNSRIDGMRRSMLRTAPGLRSTVFQFQRRSDPCGTHFEPLPTTNTAQNEPYELFDRSCPSPHFNLLRRIS
jgi:diaminopimelate decarboxylase